MELLTFKDDREEYTYYLKNGKKIQHGPYKYWGQRLFEFYYREGIRYESKEAYEDSLIANRSW